MRCDLSDTEMQRGQPYVPCSLSRVVQQNLARAYRGNHHLRTLVTQRAQGYIPHKEGMLQHNTHANDSSRRDDHPASIYNVIKQSRGNRLCTPGVTSSKAHTAKAKEGFMVGSRKNKAQPRNGPYRVSTNKINPTSMLGRVPVESCVAIDDDIAGGGIDCTWTRTSGEACTNFTIAFLTRLLVSSGSVNAELARHLTRQAHRLQLFD